MGASPAVFARRDVPEELRRRLSRLFDGMMHALFRQRGSQFSVDIVASPDAVAFISEHAAALDSSFSQVPMSDAMRRRLSRSNLIFSGMKTFHELHEAFPSLVDENGVRKPFERFLNDVRAIDKTYNANYLRAEYNFVAASADMAAKWERFAQDGDRYNLQYRTAGDGRVRPEHAALDGVTLPPSDSFWQEFYPPNGWNCFVGSTPVLTAAGWKFIKNVKPGDLVVGGSGEYRAVVAVHAREVDAELVCVRAKGSFAACTENHRLLTSRGWLAAGALMSSDILVQVGKVSALGIFFNAVGNAVTLGKYCLVLLKRKRKTVTPEAVDGDIQGRNVEIGNVTAEQPATLERQPHCRKVEADGALGFALGLADGAQPFGMPSARFKRIGQCLGSDIGAAKGCRYFKFLRYLSHKGAVRFVLALPDVLARLCKSVVNGCKVGSRLSAAAGVVFPLRPDCLASVPDGDAAMVEEAADGSSVDAPVQGQPSETALLDKVPRFGGIDNPAALDGFNSFYGFLRRTFFHTRYALVDHKGTTKKSKTVVYNLSVDRDESYVVPTGIAHNCRCSVVQVRKSKYPVTPHDEAMRRGNEALAKDTRGIFRFNPGCEQKSVPDYNPYTIRSCRTCPIAKGNNGSFARFVPDNEVCAACVLVRSSRRCLNMELYDRLASNPDYRDVVMDKTTGGVKGIHKGHIIHSSSKEATFFAEKLTSTDLELLCQDILYRKGYSCILENETQLDAMGLQLPQLDSSTNGEYMDIRAITELGRYTIRNALKAKKKQLKNFNRKTGADSHSVILYFHDASMFDESQIVPQLGNTLHKVICVFKDGTIRTYTK